jgi:hypothetical protein
MQTTTTKKRALSQSEFLNLAGIEYYRFEEDFVEANMRCIPMIVRFKMDLACIKLKLAQWSRFSIAERVRLALLPCLQPHEINDYAIYLQTLIFNHTGESASVLKAEQNPAWANLSRVPPEVQEQLQSSGHMLSVRQWSTLTNLQRFALIKLSREGHENKNLCKAAIEFGIANLSQKAIRL